MTGESALDLLWRGGPVMWPLLACSVVAGGVTIDRLWAVWRCRHQARRLHRRLAGLPDAPGGSAALPPPASPLLAVYQAAASPDRDLQRALLRLARELRRSVWLLGTIGSLAPFIGLLGTVIGIIRAFEDMARTGSGGFAVVAAGISEALVATAGGLLVGVLAIFFYNALNVRIAALVAEIGDRAEEAADRIRSQTAAARAARAAEVVPHAV